MVRYAEERGITPREAEGYETLPGKGVTAVCDGVRYAIGNAALMADEGVSEEEYAEELARVSSEGKTPLLVAADGSYRGLIATLDELKPTSRQAVSLLRGLGLKVVMLTGDNERTAAAIAARAGIDEVYAGVLPADKERMIAELSREGGVAMVGDGINDAPALTRADVGIAIGSGSDIAVDSADVVLVKSDLLDVVTAVRLGRRTLRNIKENLFWALIYNSLCIPLAAGVLFVPFGIGLSPMIGSAAMSVSSRAENECAGAVCAVGGGGEQRPAGGEDASEGEIKEQNNTPERSEEDMKTYVLGVEGMMCGHCTARVEKALRGVEGVLEVAVSLEDKTATVTGSADPAALRAAVEAADYEVVSVTEK